MTRQTDWYHKNKDRAKKVAYAWRKDNPEKVSELNRKYREEFKKKHGMTPSQYYTKKRKEQNES